MSYIRSLFSIDNLFQPKGEEEEVIPVRETKGLIKKPFELEIPEEVEVPKVAFYNEYSVLKELEDRIKNAKSQQEMPEGTGPDTVSVGAGPVRSPIYKSSEGYPLKVSEIQSIIIEEASLRGIDPEVALKIFRHEGQGSYQSTVPREGKGSLNGREASFGPWQLYVGGGLGNEYQKLTGRDLTTDNTADGIRKQTQFALDKAAESGWGAWYGRKPAGVGVKDGLKNAKPIGNWRD